jgi:hypothetical protein
MQLISELAKKRNGMADLRDKLERVRHFKDHDLERLAALERQYLDGLRHFHESLPPRHAHMHALFVFQARTHVCFVRFVVDQQARLFLGY